MPQRKARVTDEPDRGTLEELKARLGELDQLEERVGELEERVDFAERVLAQQREAGRPALPKD